MSEEELAEELEKELKRKKQPDSVIEVRHTDERGGNDSDGLAVEVKRLKKENEDLQVIVETEALKDFEDRKEAFLNLIPEEDKRTELAEKIGDDPDTLKQYEDMTGFLATMLQKSGVRVVDSEGEEVTIAGRAKLPQNNQGTGEDSFKEYVDGLYDILKDPSKTRKEKQIADQKINSLFAEMTLGIKSRGQRNRDMPYLPPTATCPNCGGALIGDVESCPSCGWKLYAKNFTPRGR